jgi:hypothetical protein
LGHTYGAGISLGTLSPGLRGCYETLDVAVQNEKMQAGARITGWLISKV